MVVHSRCAALTVLAFALVVNVNTAAAANTSPRSSSPQVAVDVGIFYDELAPYGDWVRVDEYGWVWIPAGVEVGWRPYTNGYWILTDYGWTWVSNWRWGWAPFHYGRWVFHPRHGWVWIPGRVWGPAWVVWRHGGGWVGWAPMPPQVGWTLGVDFVIAGDFDLRVEAHWYTFVPEGRLTERSLHRHFAVGARNVTLVRTTRNVTNYVIVGNRIVDRGLDVREIERAAGRKIAERRVVDGRAEARSSRGTDVPFYRPEIGPSASDHRPREAPRRAVPRDAQQQRDTKERDQLQREQERERQKLEAAQRQEQQRSAVARDRAQLEKAQEAERRAQADQRRREEAVLKDRQERRRQKEEPRSEKAEPRRGRGK